jgi:serine protease Do
LKKVAGALIAKAEADSPAAKAGIKPGDVVTAVNGVDIKNSNELARRIAEMAPGTKVDLRKGSLQTLAVTLGTTPNNGEIAQLGLSLCTRQHGRGRR